MDIRLVWDPTTGTADFVLQNGALELGHDLETAVLISLFTDQVADPEDQMPPGQLDDPRGWWADTYTDDPIGSKLWQVFWRQMTQDTLNWVQDQASKALQWMIDDGAAAAVSVSASFLGKGAIGLGVSITEPSGKRTAFAFAWSQES